MDATQARQELQKAQALYTAGRIQESLAILDLLDSAFPQDRHLSLHRALCYVELGRLSDALSLARTLEGKFTDNRVEVLKQRIAARAPGAGLGLSQPASSGGHAPLPPRTAIPERAASAAPSTPTPFSTVFTGAVSPVPSCLPSPPVSTPATPWQPSTPPVSPGFSPLSPAPMAAVAPHATPVPTPAAMVVPASAPSTPDASGTPTGPVRPSNRPVYYRHSGKFSPLFPLLFLVFGVAGTAILSVIYAYAIFYIPFVYLNVLLTLGFGIGVGGAVMGTLVLGKVRNPPLTLVSGVVCGLLAVYLAWVCWFLAASKGAAYVVLPQEMLGLMSKLAEEGVWQIKDIRPTGVWLYLIWGAEAAVIFGASVILAWRVVRDRAYCEETGRWAENDLPVTGLAPIDDPEELPHQLEAGDFSTLWRLPRLADSTGDSTAIDFLYDRDRDDFRLVSIKAVETKVNERGKEQTKARHIVHKMFVSREYYERIKKVRTLNNPFPVRR